jgi:hypothetical protein
LTFTKLVEIIKKFLDDKLFGEFVIKIEAGRIVKVERKESLR